MNLRNETQKEQATRRNAIFRLKEELQNAVPTLKEDTIYEMFKGSSRTIMTFDYYVNWISLNELAATLKAVREINNNEKF